MVPLQVGERHYKLLLGTSRGAGRVVDYRRARYVTGSITMSCYPLAAGDQQGRRQGNESRIVINDPRNSATMSCHPWATA